MRGKFYFSIFAWLLILAFAGNYSAQTETAPKKRLKNPATVRGVIGGEAHDSYVIRVRKNQWLRVEISWKKRGAETAAFVVSQSPDFFAGETVKGGKETHGGKILTVKAATTADYYIYVTGYPTATYKLKVSTK